MPLHDSRRSTRLVLAVLLGVAIATIAFVFQNFGTPLEGLPSSDHRADDHYRQWPKVGQIALSGLIAAVLWSPLAVFGRLGRWRSLAFVTGTWITTQLLFAIPYCIEVHQCNLYEFSGLETLRWYWSLATSDVRSPGVTFDVVALIVWWNAILLVEGGPRSWIPRGFRLWRHPSAIIGFLILAIHWSYAWGPLSFIWMDDVFIVNWKRDLEPAEDAFANGTLDEWFDGMSVQDRCLRFREVTESLDYPVEKGQRAELIDAMAAYFGRNADETLHYLLAISECYPWRFLVHANTLIAIRVHADIDFESDPRVMARLEESVMDVEPGWHREEVELDRLRVLGRPLLDDDSSQRSIHEDQQRDR